MELSVSYSAAGVTGGQSSAGHHWHVSGVSHQNLEGCRDPGIDALDSKGINSEDVRLEG